jgi:2-dehydro-3-deoxygluconokinase
LGVRGPEIGSGKASEGELEGFKSMIESAACTFPNVSVFATTLREVESANRHNWGAIVRADGKWYEEAPRAIDVLDRIGGGDGFAAGLLYGILKGWEPKKWLQFGWASGVLAATELSDYATPADEEQLWNIYKGNARVKR